MEVHPRGVCRKAGSYYYGSKAVEVVHQYKFLELMLTDTLSWDAQHDPWQRLAKGTCAPSQPATKSPVGGGEDAMAMSSDMQS
eukprot:g80079.t1